MVAKYKIMEPYEMTSYIYELIVVTGRSLLFSFDVRKRVNEYDRLKQTWYSLTLVECDMSLVAILISDKGDELKSTVIHNKWELDNFVMEYCNEHKDKFKGTICVNVDDWTEKEFQEMYGELYDIT